MAVATTMQPILHKSAVPALTWLLIFILSRDALAAWIVSAALLIIGTAQFIPAQGKRQYAWAGAINLLVYGLFAAGLRSPGLTVLTLAFSVLGALLVGYAGNAYLRLAHLCRPFLAASGPADDPPFRRRWHSLADWPGIFAVQRKVFPETGSALAVLAALLRGGLLTITHDGKIVAIAAVQPGAINTGRRHNIHWLHILAVLPEYRGQGHARALLAQVGPSSLAVRPENHAAIRLYETSGYTLVERWDNYYGPQADALIMLRA